MRIHSLLQVALGVPLITMAFLSGCSKAETGGHTSTSTRASAGAALPQSGNVRVIADDDGFHPSTITFVKGSPASLTFTRTTDSTCATEVTFPDLNLKKPLPLNTPTTVDVPTNEARTLAFTCGMGMYKSSVVVR